MVIRLSGTFCRFLLSQRMMWAWKFWWIGTARVGTDCTNYVRIGWITPKF